MAASVQFDIIGNDRASDAFDSASSSADRAADRFTSAADESASRLDRVAEASDSTATAAAQAAGGIGDIAGALEATGLISEGTAMALETGAAAIMGLTGAADIANLVTEKLRLATLGHWIAEKARTAATVASNVATKAATAGQWLWNAALSANPIGIVIIAIAALVAGLIWFFTQTELGRKIVAVAWAGIQKAIAAVTTWWQTKAWPTIKAVWLSIQGAFNQGREQIGRVMGVIGDVIRKVWSWSPLGLVINNWSSIMNWLRDAPGRIAGFFTGLPGRIGGALGNLFAPLGTGFRNTVNGIIAGWNNLSFTVGGGSFAGISIPSVTVSTPNIPYLASGGDIRRRGWAVVGEAGPELLQLDAGARVTPLSGQGGTQGVQEIRLVVDGSAGGEFGAFLAEMIRKFVKVQGGNVQIALGAS